MGNSFGDFLNRNSVQPSGYLPLVHTTAAYHLGPIRAQGKIAPQKCDVFAGKLSYFFFGRPAYKVRGGSGQASDWELPACLIFDYQAIPSPKRVYPFDSGAFTNGLMPHYISMMDRDNFEVSSLSNAPARIVGAYFSDVRAYFKGDARGTAEFQREFSPGVFDAEVRAVHRLALESNNTKVDDRRLTVELQIEQAIDLTITAPIAVVAPLPYFDDADFRNHVVNEWKAQPIGYPVYSLSVEQYYQAIYERVENLYKSLGLL